MRFHVYPYATSKGVCYVMLVDRMNANASIMIIKVFVSSPGRVLSTAPLQCDSFPMITAVKSKWNSSLLL